jgi:ring-1,2-phenylacetyl-CoA epoxidase subunit PaaD
MTSVQFTEAQIIDLLRSVMDPEIPVLSLVDLGVITHVIVSPETGRVTVEMTPTFAGCPAMDYMRRDVEQTLLRHGITDFAVNLTFDVAWSSNRLTDVGRQKLRDFRLSPPPHLDGPIQDLSILEYAECPNCGSTDTTLRTPFGPTLCRALHYCNACKQGFEQFKPI